jgi:hypothetical protein
MMLAAMALFLMGSMVGPIFLLLVILLLALRPAGKARERRRPPSRPRFRIGYGTSAEYLNKVLTKAMKKIANSTWLHDQLSESLSSAEGGERSVIQSMNLDSMEFSLTGSAPVVNKLQLQTSIAGDFVEISFTFRPEITVDVDMNVKIPVINNVMCVGTRLCLHRLVGCLRFEIPEKKGCGMIEIMKTTKVECDVGARVTDTHCISTEYLGPLWTALTDWLHNYLYGAKFRIEIDKSLNGRSERHPGRRSLPRMRFRLRRSMDWSIDPFGGF